VQAIARGVLLLGIPILIHFALFRLHIEMLPNSGNGDNYMSEPFQATLRGNRFERSVPLAEQPSLWAKALEHASSQFWYNRNMAVLFPRGSHQFDTAWYTWPLAWRGVYFSLVKDWAKVAAAADEKHVLGFLLHPNPAAALLTTFLALGCAGALCMLVLGCVCGRRAGLGKRCRSLLFEQLQVGGSGSLLVAFLLHWLPYATQSRQTFLLYYLPTS